MFAEGGPDRLLPVFISCSFCRVELLRWKEYGCNRGIRDGGSVRKDTNSHQAAYSVKEMLASGYHRTAAQAGR